MTFLSFLPRSCSSMCPVKHTRWCCSSPSMQVATLAETDGRILHSIRLRYFHSKMLTCKCRRRENKIYLWFRLVAVRSSGLSFDAALFRCVRCGRRQLLEGCDIEREFLTQIGYNRRWKGSKIIDILSTEREVSGCSCWTELSYPYQIIRFNNFLIE